MSDTFHRNRDLIRWYRAGLPMRVGAERTGLSIARISQIIRKAERDDYLKNKIRLKQLKLRHHYELKKICERPL